MIAPVAGDHDVAVRLATGQVVDAGELEGRLDRLRAAGHRVDRRVVDRQDFADSRGVRLEWLAGERRAVGIAEPPDLLGQDVGATDSRP